jgi:hypothetical protein
VIVNILEVPSVTRTEMSNLTSHVWRTTMHAALQVHRYHAAKIETKVVHSAETGERSVGQNTSGSVVASGQS